MMTPEQARELGRRGRARRTEAQAAASRANARKGAAKTRGRPRVDRDDPARYARALEHARRELGLPPVDPGALLPCPRCGLYDAPARVVRHVAAAHLAPERARPVPPQDAARIVARSIRSARTRGSGAEGSPV